MNFRTRGAGGNISATPELTGFDTVLNIYRLVTLVPRFLTPAIAYSDGHPGYQGFILRSPVASNIKLRGPDQIILL